MAMAFSRAMIWTKLSYLSGRYIARLNTNLDQARKGAALIGETLAQKKLKSNHGKSRYVLLGSEEVKERTRREAKEAPVMMRSHIMEESPEE